MKAEPEKLISQHGGYRKLKCFQLAPVCVQRTGTQLAYDGTVRSCDRSTEKCSRTLAARCETVCCRSWF